MSDKTQMALKFLLGGKEEYLCGYIYLPRPVLALMASNLLKSLFVYLPHSVLKVEGGFEKRKEEVWVAGERAEVQNNNHIHDKDEEEDYENCDDSDLNFRK